jgi:hypothetical protein
MRYRGENLVENSVNEGCRGWDLEDIAGDSLIPSYIACHDSLDPLFQILGIWIHGSGAAGTCVIGDLFFKSFER